MQRLIPARRIVLVAIAGVLLAFAAGIAMLSQSRRTADLPDVTGTWQSWRSHCRISKRSETYEIEVANPNGFLGGRYLGVPHGGNLQVTGPLSALCGEMTYVRDADKLEFCGEEFERVRSEETNAGAVGGR